MRLLNPANRSAEYRKRAEEVRRKAEAIEDGDTRQALMQTSDIWQQMADCEDKHNPLEPELG